MEPKKKQEKRKREEPKPKASKEEEETPVVVETKEAVTVEIKKEPEPEPKKQKTPEPLTVWDLSTATLKKFYDYLAKIEAFKTSKKNILILKNLTGNFSNAESLFKQWKQHKGDVVRLLTGLGFEKLDLLKPEHISEIEKYGELFEELYNELQSATQK